MGAAAVLWTGGKDCNLALYEAKAAGHNIVSLVTFIMGDGKLKAHPLFIMAMQAKALGIPHITIPVEEPYKENYEKAIANLKTEHGIDTLITGDIAEIHGNTNWITERAKPSGVQVVLPLWHLNRKQILDRIFSLGFKVIFSCVKEPWLNSSWLGQELNASSAEKLKTISNLDLCGEQGEYHTLVLDGPLYDSEIVFDSFTLHKDNEIFYMEIAQPSLKQKQVHGTT